MRRTLLFVGGLFILLVLGYTGTAMAGLSGLGGSPVDFDHFKCYEAEAVNPEDPPDIGGFGLRDQFEDNDPALVTTPDLFCNPVDKAGDGLDIRDTAQNAKDHLLCYKISTELPETLTIEVTNQFDWGGTQFIEVEDSNLLCVPTEKLCVCDEEWCWGPSCPS